MVEDPLCRLVTEAQKGHVGTGRGGWDALGAQCEAWTHTTAVVNQQSASEPVGSLPCSSPGALWWHSRGGIWTGWSPARERIYVYRWLVHFVGQQKLQYWKAIIVQFFFNVIIKGSVTKKNMVLPRSRNPHYWECNLRNHNSKTQASDAHCCTTKMSRTWTWMDKTVWSIYTKEITNKMDTTESPVVTWMELEHQSDVSRKRKLSITLAHIHGI